MNLEVVGLDNCCYPVRQLLLFISTTRVVQFDNSGQRVACRRVRSRYVPASRARRLGRLRRLPGRPALLDIDP